MQESERKVTLTCRLGELTVWAPVLRVWVYAASLFEGVGENELALNAAPKAKGRDGVYLRCVKTDDQTRIGWNSVGLIRYLPAPGMRHIVELNRSFDDFMSGFSSKTRSTLRRKVRRFAKENGGQLDVREYKTPEEIERFLPLARRVSSGSYQEVLLDAGLPAREEFNRDALADAGNGKCRGYLLMLRDKPVAYLFSQIQDGVAAYSYVGYDQANRQYSPGTVLLLEVLERLHTDPEVHTFDFTEGAGEDGHKAFFATQCLIRSNVYLLRPTPRNLAVILVHETTDRVSGLLGRLLQRLGLKKRIRYAIRRLRGAA